MRKLVLALVIVAVFTGGLTVGLVAPAAQARPHPSQLICDIYGGWFCCEQNGDTNCWWIG